MKSILIKNCDILDFEQGKTKKGVDLLIEDGVLSKIDKNIDKEDAYIINADEKLLLPGFNNTHNHLSMSLFRNYADDLDLMTWLNEKIWPIENKLQKEDIYWGALLSMIEMIKSGSVSFNDMYMMEDYVAQAALDIGMKGIIGRGLTRFNTDEDLEDVKYLYDTYNNEQGLLKVSVCPHAIYTTGRDFLLKCCSLRDELGAVMHTHISETIREVEDCFKENGKSPVKYLSQLGILDKKTIAAHCVHLNEEDIDILRDKKVLVSINISSNLKLASGFPNIKAMNDKKVLMSLGTDGPSSNNRQSIFDEIREVLLCTKAMTMDPTSLKALDVLKAACVSYKKYIEDEDYEPYKVGSDADFIIINMNSVNNTPRNSDISALAYSVSSNDVETVIIKGKVIMEKREMKTVDEEKVKYMTSKCMEDILKR